MPWRPTARSSSAGWLTRGKAMTSVGRGRMARNGSTPRLRALQKKSQIVPSCS
jgi:hypothetical protein